MTLLLNHFVCKWLRKPTFTGW